MADPSLNNPVIIQATRLDASILPRNVFSQSYLLYVIAQGADVGAIAGKANEAGQGAYDAQVKNDEQDVELADHEAKIQQLRIDVDDHEIRITANTNAIATLDVRLTTAEGEIVTLQADVSALDGRVATVEGNISALLADYVSKTATATQSLASPLNVTTSYSVGGISKLSVLDRPDGQQQQALRFSVHSTLTRHTRSVPHIHSLRYQLWLPDCSRRDSV